ncbi:hypothetical protein J4417_05525 [Candidatus Woesearchaeota archaeon]|nr:hypothetical protein [Candidatus Woesearchaeota archaeon]
MIEQLVKINTQQCCRCGRSLNHGQNGHWCSEWMGEKHYKSLTCACGYATSVTVSFEGSGHDNFV